MVLEVALFDVTDPDGFAAAYRGAHQMSPSRRLPFGPDDLRHRVTHRFVLLVEWDSVEAHEINFRRPSGSRPGGRPSGRSSPSPPLVEHFNDVGPD